MAFPSYTYTFTNGSTADAGQVNQNFSDILNGISDTTKNISVSAITAAGTTTLSGSVILGVSTSSVLTFNGSVGSNIPIQTNTSFDFGTATLGLKSVYVGGTSTFTTRIMSAATASWTLTLPTTAGTGSQFLQTDGSGNTSWANVSEPLLVQNLGLAASVATNALTISLKTLSGADPTSSLAVYAAFRNATAATGQYNVVSQTSALSITVPSGATLGQTSGVNQYVWVYLINDAGTLDLGVSGVDPFFDMSVNSCTQISSGATSGSVLYSGSAHTGSKPTRLIGRLLVNEAAAGTWASAPSEIALMPRPVFNQTDPVAYTPQFSASLGTPTLVNVFSWRVGKLLYVQGSWTQGTVTGATAIFSSGFNGTAGNVSFDTTLLSSDHIFGPYNSSNVSASNGDICTATPSNNDFFFQPHGSGPGATGSTLGGSPTTIRFGTLIVPILGWSAYGP